jgi:transcriptional regulator
VKHGHAIAKHIQRTSEDLTIETGSLYPALHRLENRGLLAAEWGPSETGRESKFYRLTARGRAQLKADTEAWKRLTGAIGLILRTAKETR